MPPNGLVHISIGQADFMRQPVGGDCAMQQHWVPIFDWMNVQAEATGFLQQTGGFHGPGQVMRGHAQIDFGCVDLEAPGELTTYFARTLYVVPQPLWQLA